MSENKHERGWFDYRYAIPGFVFVFLVFLMNLDLIILVLNTNTLNLDFATIIAALTFLSGPAIGFVSTQGWYALFNFLIRELFWSRAKPRLIHYKIAKEETWIVDIDYWALTNIDKKIFSYLTRRWDLFHLLCSITFIMIISPPIICVMKISLLNFLNNNFNYFKYFNYYKYLNNFNSCFIFPLSVLIIILKIIFIYVAIKIRNEYQNMIIKTVEKKIVYTNDTNCIL